MTTYLNLLIENKDVLKDYFVFITWGCGILGVAIDATPWIKFHPVKWTLKHLGRLINKEIYEKIDSIKTQVNQKAFDDDMIRIEDIRYRILEFSNSLSKRERDIEEFDFIYERHEEYDKLIKKHNLTNGKVTRAMKTIDSHYCKLPQ